MPNHNFVDMSGQVINDIRVVEFAGSNKWGEAIWNCLCLRCCNMFVATGKNLRNNKYKSCGCYKSEIQHIKKFEDITGQIFNSLFVNSYFCKNKWGNSVWNCTCLLCGNHIHETTASLKGNHARTCGCSRAKSVSKSSIIDLSNQKYGLLTPKYIVGRNKNKLVLWYCECECGGNVVVPSSLIINGGVSSCGCLVSKNEHRIKLWLEDHNIEYERQKKFDGCQNKKLLAFDFYIPSYNMVIEYDGEFHYQQIRGLNNNLEYQQNNDNIKNRFCEENNIRLLRIPYWEKDNIEAILSDWLFLNTEETNEENIYEAAG